MKMLLSLYEGLWAGIAAPLVRRTDAQTAHHLLIEMLRHADGHSPLIAAARALHLAAFPHHPVTVGGVSLAQPLILAAGFVKGDGFADETAALRDVTAGVNIIPGWRVMPTLVGAVEFGSFTRQPRLGSSGRVLWRDDRAYSTQNRIGLRNPGARAAARFLSARVDMLPQVWGVNLAPTPGLNDPDQECAEISEAAALFQGAFAGKRGAPAWYTLNLSCPNTEDDPGAHQTEAKARRLVAALAQTVECPVWVKLSPGLAAEQYAALSRACAQSGARAIIATNTLGMPTPDGTAIAGVGGGRVRQPARAALEALAGTSEGMIDLIACGGILNGRDFRSACAAGAKAGMIYSALVFRGLLAGGVILREASMTPDANHSSRRSGNE
jgi:dihydroorotate dehydrogenase